MYNVANILRNFFDYGVLVYGTFCIFSYLALAVISFLALAKYLKVSRIANYETILSSPYTPGVSLLAPAYNEGKTIVENVRSLLSLHYGKLEVIIINDGSKDDTLAKIIEAYELEKIDFAVNERIPTKTIRGIYKSRSRSFKNLTVVDKENGGKADALNVGVNVALYDYVACIDVDCILEQDSLLKMIKPFLEEEKRVIATGGVVRIANSCVVENGKLVKVEVPEKLVARIQVLEYMRAFLMGRMAWGYLDGMLLISGAFGMFDKDIVIKAGGYNHKTVGEDMELVVRMRRYMIEHDLPYKVCCIPDPLCWTEAPESFEILGRQRNRWTRGTIETLWEHRKMFFNPKYKILGMLSYPYWFFFEYLAPLIEFTGFILFLILAMFGLINWPFFFLLLLFVYFFAVLFSVMAIFAEEFTFHQYKKKTHILTLIWTACLEPVILHPFGVRAAIKGNWDKINGIKSWGDMTRAGFTKKTT